MSGKKCNVSENFVRSWSWFKTCARCGVNHFKKFNGFRTAYHYTTFENWLRIRQVGLLPYRLRPEINDHKFVNGKLGIFLWLHVQSPIEHAGSVMFHACNKKALVVVVLSVDYFWIDICLPGSKDVFYVRHDMPEEKGFWHVQIPAIIAWRPIPHYRIELLETIDVTERLKLKSAELQTD